MKLTIMRYFMASAATGLYGAARRMAMTLVLAMLTTMTAWATTTSTINVGGTDYLLFTGFAATGGNGTNYAKLVDGNTSTDWIATKSYGEATNHFNGGTDDPAFVEFHADAPFIPKGYVLTCDHENAGFWKPYSWALKAKLNTGDEWTTIHSSNTMLGAGKTFEIPCTNDDNNEYQYFRFEVYEVGTTSTLDLDELQFYGSLPAYTHLTVKAATCMATGIKQDCYRRNSDGKYFTDNTGTTELQESDVIAPIIPHTGEHHDATDVNIEYWQCSMCGKLFSDEDCTTEITEEDTKIYRTITIDGSISSLVTSNVSQALAGTTMYLYVSDLIDASTLKVNNGAVELTAVNDIQYAFTMPAADVTVTAEVAQSNGNGDILTGSVRHTVTIVDGASITLNNAAISGSIVCEGSATITLVGTNSVSGASQKAGIQIGGSGTTLTIKGDGSLTANGGSQSAGIGLSRAWDPANDVIGGDIVIEGGNITANGGSQWGAGIGTGVIYGNGSAKTARIGDITIKGGSVKATGGTSADGIGTGYTYSPCTNAIGTVTIYDGINMVDASSIKDFGSVVYMHDENNVTASKTDYFTIAEDGDRRVITPKDDTDYTITIADDIEHGTLTGAATAKYMETVNITATPDLGYWLSRLVVKDADNNDVATTGNTFQMPKGNVTVSAVFEQGTHGTTEFAWGYFGQDGFVTEATIYDGVTTVNLQQGQSYKILKYDYGYSYRKFLLDNNTYDATIPYSGGTGTFPEYGNGTNFRVDYNSESGFYDITMTDVGNDKWSVSILKTVGVIDNVPDQTYTGSEITPEPLVLAGSLSLTKGTDYEYSYTNNTNVGTATVTVTFKGNYASIGSVNKTFTINPASVTLTANSGTKEYSGEAQTLTGFTSSVDGLTFNGVTASGSGTNTGTYDVTFTGVTLNTTKDESGNYVVTETTNGTLTITAKTVSDDSALKVTQDQNGFYATFTGSANDAVNIPDAITVKSVTLERNFSNGKYATLMLPFTMTDGMTLTGAKIYQFVGVEKVEGQWIATMQTPTSPLQANTPYLVEPVTSDLTDGKVTFDLNGGTVTLKTETSNEGSTNTDWQFVGTYTRLTYGTAPFTGYAYGFASKDKTVDGVDVKAGEFVYAKEGAAVPPLRCFLKYKNGEEFNGTRVMSRHASPTDEMPQTITVRLLGANGETTGIGTLDTRTGEFTTDGWYDMNGRKLSGKPTKKGLYINNGKKVVIK